MCPIPLFDHNNVLPPYNGNPTQRNHLSPYFCDTLELCQRFATSTERIAILRGLLEFRERMLIESISSGFQWIDGSFTENIETSESRPPNDLDIVTFFGGIDMTEQNRIMTVFPEFYVASLSKTTYGLDHYPFDYAFEPNATVEMTRYWIQLFTHNRIGIWKGLLRIELNTPNVDANALSYLNSL